MKTTIKIVIVIAILLAIYMWYNKKYSVAAKQEKLIDDQVNNAQLQEAKDKWLAIASNFCEIKANSLPSMISPAFNDACNNRALDMANNVIDWQVVVDQFNQGSTEYIDQINNTLMNATYQA